jgi:FixJ family two-component response regulator
VAARLPQLLVDPILIEQVLVNLLKNAAEAIDNASLPTAPRSIELRVVPKHSTDWADADRVLGHRLGPGSPDEVLDPLYEAFFSTKAEGMGIGLGYAAPSSSPTRAGCRRRTSTMAPWSSAADSHSRFWIPEHLRQEAYQAFRQRSENRTYLHELDSEEGHVYVVDDDEAVRDSLQWLLEGKDYRVRCFDSAESFLARYDPREVACLIVDIRMAGMTGLELQDRLIERKSPLPIVFITGHGDVPMAVQTMKKGAMDFIQKPFKEEELRGPGGAHARTRPRRLLQPPEAASRDALLSKLTTPRGPGAGAHRCRPPEQADRRRPRHQHQDGGGAPRQHHGKAQRQHRGRPAQDRPRARPPRPRG